ncbi:response regulator transcription factor [Lactobacillus helsingborgensis]|uniref:response regulator transcription factor n=1 Tax=Lactobacillus helsingborgensis TaxID=1218494 RepID=UPI0027404BF9|nr:response regulator transcription factor [Lactobacillus helsingborgensis]WLT00302.1 response regulator transcription factor [Lactobacillus helsingborgensis]
MRNDIFIYVYDVIFILLFMSVVCNCAVVYNLSKKKLFLLLKWLFISFIFESTFETGYEFVTRSIIAVGSRKIILNYWYLLVEFAITFGENIITIFCLNELTNMNKKLPVIPIANILALTSLILEVIFLTTLNPADWYIAGKSTNQICQFIILLLFCLPWKKLSQNQQIFYICSFIALGLSLIEIGAFSKWQRLIDVKFPFYENHVNLIEDGYYFILAIVILFITKQEHEEYTHRQVENLVQQRLSEYTVQKYENKDLSFQKEEVHEFCDHYGLTKREVDVLLLVLQGESNQAIADKLYITVGTVKAHVHNILNKMEVSRRSQLINKFLNYH